MKYIILSLLFTSLSYPGIVFADVGSKDNTVSPVQSPIEKTAEPSQPIAVEKIQPWNYRANINTLYLLAGSLSAELEFSPEGRWTNSIGVLYLNTNLLSSSLSGISVRWNYYFAPTTYQDSWVLGLGLSLVRGAFLGFSSISLAPEINIGYKWNFKPMTLLVGAGLGVANGLVILQLGYGF